MALDKITHPQKGQIVYLSLSQLPEKFIGLVKDISSKRITVMMYGGQERIKGITVGDDLKVSFQTLTGEYLFESTILEKYSKDPRRIVISGLYATPICIEYRSYLRLNASFLIRLKSAIGISNDIPEFPDTSVLAEGLNLSAGGIRFVSKLRIEEGTWVEIEIPLDEESILAAGKILSREYDSKKKAYFYRSNFLSLNEKEKKKLVSHVYRVVESQQK
jgi:c-di-GMP-binding flagellar brake protein YcgR